MGPFRYLIAILCICHCSLFAVTGNINVQFLLGVTENGTFQGTYHITFGLYATVNASEDDALWSETQGGRGKVNISIIGDDYPNIISILNRIHCIWG